MHPIRVGMCGWSYGDWKGVFYPNLSANEELIVEGSGAPRK
jgi:uncharacterized protein YecE (DUF72 family)